MSYDMCSKQWNDGKDHSCVEMHGHGGMCMCSCGEQRFIRDTPLKKLVFSRGLSRAERRRQNAATMKEIKKSARKVKP